jgi:hypothetical protein
VKTQHNHGGGAGIDNGVVGNGAGDVARKMLAIELSVMEMLMELVMSAMKAYETDVLGLVWVA